jgi:putative FmdB family regulatory protein
LSALPAKFCVHGHTAPGIAFSRLVLPPGRPGPIIDLEQEAPVGGSRRSTMPIYVFRCGACGEQFERTMAVAERVKAVPPCPKCGSERVQPVLSGFSAKTSRKS